MAMEVDRGQERPLVEKEVFSSDKHIIIFFIHLFIRAYIVWAISSPWEIPNASTSVTVTNWSPGWAPISMFLGCGISSVVLSILGEGRLSTRTLKLSYCVFQIGKWRPCEQHSKLRRVLSLRESMSEWESDISSGLSQLYAHWGPWPELWNQAAPPCDGGGPTPTSG
jgi:hypothetical protein